MVRGNDLTAVGEPTLSAANLKDAGDSIDTSKKSGDGQGKNTGTTTGTTATSDATGTTLPAKFGAPDPTGDPLMTDATSNPNEIVAHFEVPTHQAGPHATLIPPPRRPPRRAIGLTMTGLP